MMHLCVEVELEDDGQVVRGQRRTELRPRKIGREKTWMSPFCIAGTAGTGVAISGSILVLTATFASESQGKRCLVLVLKNECCALFVDR
jgi:hypothetical protein